MARAMMEAFPQFPKMKFETSRKAMEEVRREMALQVLEASGVVSTTYLNNLKALHIYSD